MPAVGSLTDTPDPGEERSQHSLNAVRRCTAFEFCHGRTGAHRDSLTVWSKIWAWTPKTTQARLGHVSVAAHRHALRWLKAVVQPV